MLYAKKVINSGDMKEIYYYPVLSDGRNLPFANPICKEPTSDAQRRAQEAYNRKKASDSLVRMVNANFTEGDLFVTATFNDDDMPDTYEAARAKFVAYMRRVNRARAKQGLDKAKYIYVIEEQERKTGEHKGEKSYHFHFFMSKMNRDEAEDLWYEGNRINADRYQPFRFGQESAARYMAKAPKGARKFVCSRNCVKPKISKPVTLDIPARKIIDMAEDRKYDREFWERKAKGYQFMSCEANLNERNGKYYIRVVYRRNEWNSKKNNKERVMNCVDLR